MTPHPDQDDDRGPSSDELIWWHGRLVESDMPDYLEERSRRARRRRLVDYPDDEPNEE